MAVAEALLYQSRYLRKSLITQAGPIPLSYWFCRYFVGICQQACGAAVHPTGCRVLAIRRRNSACSLAERRILFGLCTPPERSRDA
jgi:hypothetical protein